MVYKVTSKADLESKLAEAGDLLVVIDFFATWCGPCKRISPKLEELAKEHAGKLVLLKVDVDEVEELVGEYKIDVMPTFIFKRRGQHLDTLAGSNEDKLTELINKHLLSLKKLVYRNSTIQEKFNKTFPNWNPNKHYVDVKEFNSFRDKVATIFKDLNYSPQDEMDNATMNDLFVMKPDRFPFITWLGCARTWNKSIDCEMLNHVESVQDRRCTTILHRGALYHDQKQRPHLFNGEKLIPDYRNDSYFNAKEVVKVLINFEPGDYADLKRQIGSRIIFHGNNYVASMTEPDFFVTRGFKYDFNVDREDVILENDAKGCTDYDENLPLYKNRVDARTPLYGETCFQNCVIKNVIHRSNCWPTTMPYYRNDSYDPKLEIKSCPWFREPPYFAIYRELLRVEQLLEAANQTSESTSSQSTTVDPLTPAGGSGNLFKEEMRAYMKIRRHCWNKCQHACTLTKYSVAVSKSVWPSDVDIELDKTTWYREFRQCCALVTVKYSHFYYNVHEFMPKYNLVDVIGNLGGLLAVWLNLSIVEFYHAIQKLLTFFGEQSFSKLNTYISSLKL